MKKINLIIMWVVIVTCLLYCATQVAAQTFDLGEGRKATLDQAGNYKVTWNQKTDNGGTVVGTFTGVIKDGKRNGTWVGRITYTNFYMTNGNAKSGTETITRGYTDGKVNGAYTYNNNTNTKTCSYNYQTKSWRYGQPQSFIESVSGNFKDGQPHGKFIVSRNKPFEKITMSFDSGKPSGDWVWQNTANTTFGFKGDYLVRNSYTEHGGYKEVLSYKENEVMESLPNQDVALLTNVIPYFEYYMQGGKFASWFDKYPPKSSDDDFSKISYKIADFSNHIKK